MIYLAACWLVCAGILFWLAATAPEGWQDAAGWHAGPQSLDDLGCQQTDAGFTPEPFHHASELPQ